LNTQQRSISWFTLVGIAAAGVHYLVAIVAEYFYPAACANVLGFLCAFPVSYIGHRKLSFAQQKSAHRQAFPRFFAIACTGFAINQSLVLSGLHFTHLPFWLVLGLVMVIVAVSTYLLSRYWAFKA
jgi:putative flippase GtrA